MAYLALDGLWKRFGSTVAVAGLSLEIERGEFVSLLGPSGCGKTTTLRLVAGLLPLDDGEIQLEGQAVSRVPAPQRGMGMVFQTWALFPNMTAAQNIGFPLRVRGLSGRQISARVAYFVGLLGLEGLEHRYPHELSGGQQQRVALGRALARDPRVLLLDEPLSALDAPVRRGLVVEIRRLQQQLGITTIYVTHDQEEALGMSDRVALMDRGRVIEIGSPERLYYEPGSASTATFIGATNMLLAEVTDPDRLTVSVAGLTLRVPDLRGTARGHRVHIGVRPEDIRLLAGAPAATDRAMRGRVLSKTFLGAVTRFDVQGGGTRLRVDAPSLEAAQFVGQQEVWLVLPNSCHVVEVLHSNEEADGDRRRR